MILQFIVVALVSFLALMGMFSLLIITTNTLNRFIKLDDSPVLRASCCESHGHVTGLSYAKDARQSDSPVVMEYQFKDCNGHIVNGRYVGTESSFTLIKVGDQVLIRYVKDDPALNMPKDAIGKITPLADVTPEN